MGKSSKIKMSTSRARKPRLSAAKENVPPARFEQAQKASNVSDMVLMAKQIREEAARAQIEQQEQIDFLEHSGKEAKHRLAQALGEKAHAQKQLEEATATVESQARELASLKDRERRLVDQSSGWRQDSVECEDKMLQVRATLEQLESQNRHLSQQLESIEAERGELLRTSNQEISTLATQRNGLMDELDATKLALAEARSELGSRIDGNKSLEQQVRQLQDDFTFVQNQRDDAAAALEQLRNRSEATFMELKHRSELCEELTRHRKGDAQTLAQARDEVQYLNDMIAQLSGHNNVKQKIQRVQKIELDNVNLRKENLDLRNQIRKFTLHKGATKVPATVEAAAEDVLQRAKRNVSAAGAKDAVTDNCKKLSADRGIKNPKQLTQPRTPNLHSQKRVYTRKGTEPQ